ncbi:acyl-CoA synthetase [Aeromicrobium sp. Root472D3]|uniref:acyl-CoA synthetase n=1 Tax=Aeromicrobium sp. Root472D3 TaxID=1736540 RepID=UPI0007021F84|nr:acyl-CoA synthetase [Aeromicrobium sp. Root472D3]KQX73844.1 acyl-CoA synthetase [Aeromicrobium sp. Root472D3]
MLLTSLHGPADLEDAVTVGDASLSRADLLAAATRFAASLPDDGPVAVDATASLDTVVAVVGCLLAGVPVVPVPPDSGPAELAHVLRDSAATTWVGGARPSVDLPRLDVGDGTTRRAVPSPASLTEGTAMIVYTSGTTGSPKGVEMSHGALAAGLDALADAWAWTPDDVLVHGLPLFHTHGLILGVLGSLRVGSRLVHTVTPRPERYAAAKGSMYFAVPTVWSRVVKDEASARALAGARLLVSGSAPLVVSVFEGLAALTGHAPIERYGMTETMITLSTRVDGERRPGWVGTPVLGAETRVLAEETGEQVAADGESIGRLEVRGPMLFDGYLGRPEATAETWTDDGWFVTGDLATRDAHGFHRLVGRASTDLVKSGGYRIGTGEIEAALLDHPAVEEVAVVGLPDDDLGQRVAAFVVTAGSARAGLEAELIDLVASQLSWHKRPRQVVFVDSLPRNAMGKVQKTQLG